MNVSLQNIITLAGLDKDNTTYQEKKEELKINLNNHIKERSKILEAIEELEQKIQTNKLSINKNNTYLQELSAKLEDISSKNAKVKTEKEAKALGLEEDIAKEQITFANEEIKRYEKAIDTTQEDIETYKQQLKEIQEQIATEEKSVEKEIKTIEKDENKVSKNKDKLMNEIDTKALAFYTKIRNWAGDTSVVPVIEQICHGCFIKLNDQSYIDILKNEEITTCTHCGRILYVEKEEPQAE